jgi:bifunctional non-homologous end joining protein LigD
MPLVLRTQPFDDPDWLFELKYDGWRALAYVQRSSVTLVSRTGHIYTRFETLAREVRRELRVQEAVFDGEG